MEGERSLRGSLSARASVLSEMVSAQLDPVLESNGINFGTFELLSAAHATDGKASQAELARRLGITAPSLCEAVKAAVAKGLVEQRPNKRDRREHRIHLTRKGAGALRKILTALAAIEQRMTLGISAEDLDVAICVLGDAAVNLSSD